ncbi:MAG: molybdenum cofactor biosynthesis protein MoaE [Dehalococcoidia bacterium]|nr:MAG: molybdenum cofactor biosynthesis protein MoaE [Dehalococcoidia bacterium]
MEIVTADYINPNEIYDKIQKETVGSVVLHFAVVRERTGNQVTQTIEFQPAGDIESELKSIADSMRDRWQIEDMLIIRRIGVLHVGDVMSLVAASAPHREDAFDACRYGVESLKQMRTIKKTER